MAVSEESWASTKEGTVHNSPLSRHDVLLKRGMGVPGKTNGE